MVLVTPVTCDEQFVALREAERAFNEKDILIGRVIGHRRGSRKGSQPDGAQRGHGP